MAWIESHTVLRNHRKVLMLSRSLKITMAQTIGHLHLLWHAALDQQEDGDLTKWPDELIAELAGYDGDPAEFVGLLQENGWLDGKVIHDWWEYAGRYLQSKYGKVPDKWKEIKSKLTALNQQSTSRIPHIPNQPNLHNQHNLHNQPKYKDGDKVVPCGTRAIRVFVKPELQQVIDYCKEIGANINPEQWIAHYEANGWKVGRNPMKDWKAAVRTWKHRDTTSATPAKPQAKRRQMKYEDQSGVMYERGTVIGGVEIV